MKLYTKYICGNLSTPFPLDNIIITFVCPFSLVENTSKSIYLHQE